MRYQRDLFDRRAERYAASHLPVHRITQRHSNKDARPLIANPQKWLDDRNSKAGVSKPTDSKDPEFLYLYGRALMLTGNHREAMQAFELALNNLRTEPKPRCPWARS